MRFRRVEVLHLLRSPAAHRVLLNPGNVIEVSQSPAIPNLSSKTSVIQRVKAFLDITKNTDDGETDLAMVAAEREQTTYPNPTAPAEPPIYTLHSQQPLGRRYQYICSLAVISTAVTCYSVYYAFNASLSSYPFLPFLWYSPDITIFTLNLLAQTSNILLSELTNTVCDHLRWSRLGSTKGISALSFLALGIATSTFGLVSLALLGISKGCCTRRSTNWKLHDNSYGRIAVQRYFFLLSEF